MTKKADLAKVYEEKARARRARNLALAEAGVEFVDIDRAYISEEVTIGAGTVIGPDVEISGATAIGARCYILAGTRIENCKIGDGVTIDRSVLAGSLIENHTTVGPFAYVRPGCDIGARVRIGDFVEVKNSFIGDDTKVSHLSYIGDADLGSGINVGCGVVFVNYDGKEKHRSYVSDDAFIGCNVNIISPVSIGEGAYVAAGTTVTRNVPAGALCVDRPKAKVLEGWVERRGLLKGRMEKRLGTEQPEQPEQSE
ncbi:MAG: UDP-N-acetylglucosamine diphosphorylase [Clostridiales Family XIII bacterium]|nr:UDP-N-acetylglucosamine diphosphorylase [Clostridiales Family XIII bacterium]